MTYPPQQPGPGGWGQQPQGGVPGQSPQEGTPQQQPAWYGNQHTGWGQGQGQGQGWGQGQPPPPPPLPGPQQQPQQQPPPPPDWGGVEFGQSSWILESNAFGDAEPQQPKKKKSKLPWILGIVAVLVVAGGGAAGLFFFLNSGPGDPKPVAQQVVQKVNAGDFESIKGQLCQSRQSQLEEEISLLQTGKYDIRLGQVTENGDKASVRLTGTYSMDGNSDSVDQTMALVVEDGQWKVCQFDQ